MGEKDAFPVSEPIDWLSEKARRRGLFALTLEQLSEARSSRCDLYGYYTSSVAAEIRKERPKWSKLEDYELTAKLCKELGNDGLNQFLKPFLAYYWRQYASLSSDINWLKFRLRDLAPETPIDSSPVWSHVKKEFGSSHHTQGFGANAYARGIVENLGLGFEAYGVETRLVVEKLPYPKGGGGIYYVHTDNFSLEAKCSPLDVQIILNRPALSMRDWIKACWKRGLNPRVYNPWLPHGLEEKLGLDYFGNDVRKVG